MPFISLNVADFTNSATKAASTASSYRGKNAALSRVRLLLIKNDSRVVGFFSASNGAQTVTQRFIPSEHDMSEGTSEVLLDGAKLRSIVSSYKTLAGETKVKLSWESEFGASKGLISASRSRLKIDTDDPATYPSPLKMADSAVEVFLPVEHLQTAVKAARHAVGQNHSIAALNGICMTVEDGSLTVTSADGHRVYNSHIDVNSPASISAILPSAIIDLVLALPVASLGEEARLRVDECAVEFTVGATLIRSTLVDGKFPDIKPFLSSPTNWLTTLEKSDLVAALNRLQASVNTRLPAVLLNVDIENCSLNLQTMDSGKVVGEDSIPIDNATPCEQTLSFNIHYLLDAFASSLTSKTRIGVDKEKGFLVLESDNKQSHSIVMPMRV